MRAIVAAACLVLVALLARPSHASEPAKYVLMSTPRLSKVAYVRIPTGASAAPSQPVNLIASGLKAPQGLALDSKRNRLYVADPGSQKIFFYDLAVKDGVLSTVTQQGVAANNVEARWVAVDGRGNIFFTDERQNMVQMVSVTNMLRGNPTPVILYTGSQVQQVSAPGGIAADNFHLYWSNKLAGSTVGAVVKAFEQPPDTGVEASASALSRNSNKVYGVCMAEDNIFYTDSSKFIYGVKKIGGGAVTISDKTASPRGCAWDGDGTIYVADKSLGALYSFPGNMASLQPAKLNKVVDFEDAFGVAVLSGAVSRVATAMGLLPLLLLVRA